MQTVYTLIFNRLTHHFEVLKSPTHLILPPHTQLIGFINTQLVFQPIPFIQVTHSNCFNTPSYPFLLKQARRHSHFPHYGCIATLPHPAFTLRFFPQSAPNTKSLTNSLDRENDNDELPNLDAPLPDEAILPKPSHAQKSSCNASTSGYNASIWSSEGIEPEEAWSVKQSNA